MDFASWKAEAPTDVPSDIHEKILTVFQFSDFEESLVGRESDEGDSNGLRRCNICWADKQIIGRNGDIFSESSMSRFLLLVDEWLDVVK